MIPAFDMSEVLPPFTGNDPAQETNMSPYAATMQEVVTRFGTTAQRCEILEGLLRYRAALHSSGLVSGFQWLDGSFVENIEASEGRAPNDVDVVTFFLRPVPDRDWKAWFWANSQLFNSAATKTAYKCDAYGVDLGTSPENIVRHTRYWFGLFSHRRISRIWKGMVQIQLDRADDAAASAVLRGLMV